MGKPHYSTIISNSKITMMKKNRMTVRTICRIHMTHADL